MASRWAFITQVRNGAPLGDVAPYLQDRVITLLLNRISTVRGKINLNAPAAQLSWLQAGQTEMIVRRDGVALETVFVLTKATPVVTEDGGYLDLEWSSISSYLRDLSVLADTARNEAQSLHAWNLINTALGRTGASVYAITRGLVPGTDPVKQTIYGDNIDVLTAIENLSERDDGFDFAVNASREFDCYYPQRGSDNGLVLHRDAAGGGNVAGFVYDIDAGPGRIVTDIAAKGGNGASVTATDATAQATYGRREAYLVYPQNVSGTTAVQQQADKDLDTAKSPLIIPDLRLRQDAVEFTSYGLGDTVTVQLKAGSGDYVNIDDTYRIVGQTITLNDLDSEMVSLELNEARVV